MIVTEEQYKQLIDRGHLYLDSDEYRATVLHMKGNHIVEIYKQGTNKRIFSGETQYRRALIKFLEQF